MQFSAFIFILIVITPSIIHSIVLSLMKIPVRISFKQTNLPLQLLILGILLPLPSYLISSSITTACLSNFDFFQPINILIGLLKIEKIEDLNNFINLNSWLLFISIYYTFCVFFALVVSMAFKVFDSVSLSFEKLSIIDEEKYISLNAKNTDIELDILTIDGNFIYCGKIDTGYPEIYFTNKSVVLKDVIKIKNDDQCIDLEEYKAQLVIDGKLKTTDYLKRMIFPKDAIANINVKIDKVRNNKNVTLT